MWYNYSVIAFVSFYEVVMIGIHSLQPIEPYGSNCYLISSGDEYIVIDPSADYESALSKYPSIAGRVKYILLTHSHFDHMLAINTWTGTGATVVVGNGDVPALSDAHLNCYLGFLGVDDGYYGPVKTVSDGEILEFGQEKIEVIGCPGHTPGGLSYKIGDRIFCGDTVFAQGGYGRCDLPGGDIETLEKTLIKLITHLTDATFYPGHGSTTTLREIIYYFS